MMNVKRPPVTAPCESDSLIADFESFVSAHTFPCVGAKSALSRDQIHYEVCDRLGSAHSAEQLRLSLARFSAQHPTPDVAPVSFAAIFRDNVFSEDDFHQRLWMQLQSIHDLDSRAYPWAPGVSDDPASAEFSFSVASRAFFVVGLHPLSSRLARRAPKPTLVFNFHDQFEALRRTGRYDKMQAAIRKRDTALQGSINPMLARFGETSEAGQYSGHPRGSCPFHCRSSAS
jgi:uncharacterized protein